MKDDSLSGKDELTMADLARLAGVSEATVSRALAESPLVNPRTRERIKMLARKHNYVLNTRARNFRMKRTGTINAVIPVESELDQPISDPFFMELLGAVADALNARGHDLLLSRVDVRGPEWPRIVHDPSRADGAIVIGQSDQHEVLNRLADEGLPFVVWGGRLPDQRYCTVGCDNVAAGELATAHLLAHGRRRIAFFGMREMPEVELRWRGHVRALADAGLAPDPALECRIRFTAAEAEKATADLLAGGAAPDAIFATSDLLAMAAIKALSGRGVRVPEDIAVVGFDDIRLARWYSPPLTTISQHIGQGGRLLVDILMARLAGKKVTPTMLVPELVVRASCGSH